MDNILISSNYDSFLLKNNEGEWNRPISESHVKALMEKMTERAKKGLQPFAKGCPITVSPDLVICDGQHRFEAARRLKIPFYYIVDESISNDEAPNYAYSINSVGKKWTTVDLLRVQAALGNENAIRLVKTALLIPALNKAPETILSISKRLPYRSSYITVIKSQTYAFSENDSKNVLNLRELIEAVSFEIGKYANKKENPNKGKCKEHFIPAFCYCANCEDVDMDTLLYVVKNEMPDIKALYNPEQLLSDIALHYNAHKRGKNRIEFARIYQASLASVKK